jgi:hypothetical protein
MHCKQLKFFFFLLTTFSLSFGDFTIHLLNPWAKDTARVHSPVYIVSGEPGYYPGTQMTLDFGNWLMYTFKNTSTTSNDRIGFRSVIPTTVDFLAKPLIYPDGSSQFLIKDLFTGHENATDIWLMVNDTTQLLQIQFTSPSPTAIASLNAGRTLTNMSINSATGGKIIVNVAGIQKTPLHLTLYAIDGRIIAETIAATEAAGSSRIEWHPTMHDMSAGVYLVSVKAVGVSVSQRITIAK